MFRLAVGRATAGSVSFVRTILSTTLPTWMPRDTRGGTLLARPPGCQRLPVSGHASRDRPRDGSPSSSRRRPQSLGSPSSPCPTTATASSPCPGSRGPRSPAARRRRWTACSRPSAAPTGSSPGPPYFGRSLPRLPDGPQGRLGYAAQDTEAYRTRFQLFAQLTRLAATRAERSGIGRPPRCELAREQLGPVERQPAPRGAAWEESHVSRAMIAGHGPRRRDRPARTDRHDRCRWPACHDAWIGGRGGSTPGRGMSGRPELRMVLERSYQAGYRGPRPAATAPDSPPTERSYRRLLGHVRQSPSRLASWRGSPFCSSVAMPPLPGPARSDRQDDPLAPRAKGSLQAPITVFEMSDFQCPYCRRHAVENVPADRAGVHRDGKGSMGLRQLPHPLTPPERHPGSADRHVFGPAGRFLAGPRSPVSAPGYLGPARSTR